MTTTVSQSKVTASSQVYHSPPVPQAMSDDFYSNRSRRIFAEQGRKKLESLVNNRMMREACKLVDSRDNWRMKRPSRQRNSSHKYIQRWPWSSKIWTTSAIFVPTHYDYNRIPGSQPNRSEYSLSGIEIRISERQNIIWREAQIPTSLDFVLENDASQPMGWKSHSIAKPLKPKFERALAEHLADETLAAVWYSLHKVPLQ